MIPISHRYGRAGSIKPKVVEPKIIEQIEILPYIRFVEEYIKTTEFKNSIRADFKNKYDCYKSQIELHNSGKLIEREKYNSNAKIVKEYNPERPLEFVGLHYE